MLRTLIGTAHHVGSRCCVRGDRPLDQPPNSNSLGMLMRVFQPAVLLAEGSVCFSDFQFLYGFWSMLSTRPHGRFAARIITELMQDFVPCDHFSDCNHCRAFNHFAAQ
jgi:hypothetical protein